MMNLKSLLSRYSVDQLKEAIRYSRTQGKVVKLEQERDSLLKSLERVNRKLAKLGGSEDGSAASKPGRSGRKPGRKRGYKLSAATREKMRLAALRRYGKLKDEAPSAVGTGKRKRKPFSPETKARMAAAQRARWAKVKGTAEPKPETNS